MRTKIGIVRPGNKVPYSKATQAQIDERIAYTETLLRRGVYLKHKLIARLKEKFGVSWGTATIYINRARERLLIRLDQAKHEHRADSLAFYEGILQSATATPLEKIRARERVDKLLGLDLPSASEPLRIEHCGVIAHSEVDVETLGIDIATKRKLLDAIKQKENETNENAEDDARLGISRTRQLTEGEEGGE